MESQRLPNLNTSTSLNFYVSYQSVAINIIAWGLIFIINLCNVANILYVLRETIVANVMYEIKLWNIRILIDRITEKAWRK